MTNVYKCVSRVSGLQHYLMTGSIEVKRQENQANKLPMLLKISG